MVHVCTKVQSNNILFILVVFTVIKLFNLFGVKKKLYILYISCELNNNILFILVVIVLLLFIHLEVVLKSSAVAILAIGVPSVIISVSSSTYFASKSKNSFLVLS